MPIDLSPEALKRADMSALIAALVQQELAQARDRLRANQQRLENEIEWLMNTFDLSPEELRKRYVLQAYIGDWVMDRAYIRPVDLEAECEDPCDPDTEVDHLRRREMAWRHLWLGNCPPGECPNVGCTDAVRCKCGLDWIERGAPGLLEERR